MAKKKTAPATPVVEIVAPVEDPQPKTPQPEVNPVRMTGAQLAEALREQRRIGRLQKRGY